MPLSNTPAGPPVPGRRLVLRRCSRGVAATELALVAPFLALIVAGTINLGLGLYAAVEVREAAAAGGQYVALKGFDASAIASTVTNAASVSNLAATPAPSQICGCPGSAGITAISCTATCPSGAIPGTYARVYAQATYTPPIAFPALSGPYLLQSHVTVRLQ